MEKQRIAVNFKSYEKLNELEKLALPLYDWLQDNYSPHTTIIIECGFIRVVESICGVPLPVRD